jgi:chromosome segregation ATPase
MKRADIKLTLPVLCCGTFLYGQPSFGDSRFAGGEDPQYAQSISNRLADYAQRDAVFKQKILSLYRELGRLEKEIDIRLCRYDVLMAKYQYRDYLALPHAVTETKKMLSQARHEMAALQQRCQGQETNPICHAELQKQNDQIQLLQSNIQHYKQEFAAWEAKLPPDVLNVERCSNGQPSSSNPTSE